VLRSPRTRSAGSVRAREKATEDVVVDVFVREAAREERSLGDVVITLPLEREPAASDARALQDAQA
jgi:hypothetical protein